MSTRILLQPHVFKNTVNIDSTLNLNGSLNLNGESLSTSLSSKAALNKVVNTISGSSYTLLATDNGTIINYDSVSDITVSIPATLVPVGSQFTFVQYGLGKIIIEPALNVVCNNLNNGTKSSGQYGVMTLTQVDLNIWVLSGDVTV
jgi:hypothetical protein